jgi:phosphoribosylaminoimidazole (AIR) synthetase
VAQQCTPGFETYTGLDYLAAEHLDYGAFVPVAAGWAEGDREVACYLVRVDGAKLTGSLRGAPSTSP